MGNVIEAVQERDAKDLSGRTARTGGHRKTNSTPTCWNLIKPEVALSCADEPDFPFGHQQRAASAFRNFDGFNLWGVHPIAHDV
jgi:hypothetical protein